ncbi:MAG: rRNA (guanine1207-N2)-methyltransferase [Actinomycetota bacterium]|jgi:16S rRNA G1207 methylase RsmC|nr:rRNA (guanine1207-N2)-methyltransferase [Actinomycetota bacterium]
MSEHYFSSRPHSAPEARRVRLVVDGRAVELTSASGVFSADHLDRGTRVLLEHAARPPATGRLLDLGCGYGPIACALAIRAPGAVVHAVDVNERALELTTANAAELGLPNVQVGRPDELDAGLRFDRIYSNPPIRVGKAALHALLATWLDRLTEDGAAHLVVQRNLGSDSLQRWLRDQGWSATRAASIQGFRILDVRREASG